MKKGSCVAWTVVFLALAGVSGWFVYRRAPSGGTAFVGGLVGGVILLIVFSWLSAIPRRIYEWWLIVRSRLGGEPRDGARAAIIGTLRGHGELTAPLSGERCVLYSYEIATIDSDGRNTTMRTAYEGFAMVPLAIEHGADRTRLLAKPELRSLSKTAPRIANAKQYVEDTTFEPASKEEKDLSHTDGHLRYDYQRAGETNLDASSLIERILPPDAHVCAIGTYRADRRALLAPLTLRTGTTFGIDAAWRVVNAALGVVIFAAIALAAAAVFCANFPIDAVEQAHPHWNLRWWEIDLERFVQKRVRTPLVNAGVLTAPGYRLQELCEGCARGRLEIDGRMVELRHARYVGGRTVHLSATPNARDGVTLAGGREVTVTVNGRAGRIPDTWLQPGDVETSLGSNGEYAGRVTIVDPNGSIRCRVYFQTRVDEDAWLPSRG